MGLIPKRILVVHPGALGDVLLSLPAIAGLRRKFPMARVEMVGQTHLLQLLEMRFYADKIWSIDMGQFHTLFSGDPSQSMVRRLSDYDLLISWFGSQDATYKTTLRRVTTRSIIEKPFPPEGGRTHVIDHLISTLSPLGIEVEDRAPKLYLTDGDRAYARDFLERRGLASDGRRTFAIHPGSGSPRKCWPAERFADLAAKLIDRFDARVLLVRGPADAAPAEGVTRGVGHAHLTVLQGLSLIELASVLERCDGFIGHDSGITHLAAAVGTKVLALFGPTDPAVWGPRGASVTILHTELATLGVDTVLDALKANELIKEPRKPPGEAPPH